MQVPKRLNKSELQGLEWKLPNLKTQFIELPENSKIYSNNKDQTFQRFSNYKKQGNMPITEDDSEDEINMLRLEQSIDKIKTLRVNREKNNRFSF